MEFDIKSGRMIYLVLEKYHSATQYRYKHDRQRFRITLYCYVHDTLVKKYLYRCATEKQLYRDIINKYRGRRLFKIAIEPVENKYLKGFGRCTDSDASAY